LQKHGTEIACRKLHLKMEISMKNVCMRLLGVLTFISISSGFARAAALDYSKASEVDISNLQKLREVKPVLLNVLYRAGGPGGAVLLPSQALTSLCKAGFSSAIYVYDDKYPSNQPIQCQDSRGRGNQMNYRTISFRDQRAIFAQIRSAMTSHSGPVLVHCWNGWHASGEISATALMQFCDWSGNQAAQYWEDNIGDRGNIPKYGKIKQRIRSFKPFEDLRLSPQIQAEVCPKPH
jgi:hypothetical protein